MGSLETELHKIRRAVNRLSRHEMPIVGPGGVVPAPVAQYDHLEASATPAWIRVQNQTMADDTYIGLPGPGGRLVFDLTPTPDHLKFLDCYVGVNEATPAARLHVSAATAPNIPLIVQTMDDDPTNNLTEWRDSGGTPLSSINTSGFLGIGSPADSQTMLNLSKTFTSGASTHKGASLTPRFAYSTASAQMGLQLVATNTVGKTGAAAQAALVGGNFAARFLSASGNIPNMIGGSYQIQNSLAGGTVGNGYGQYIFTPIATGEIANSYGLYIENHNVATTLNYAVYTNAGDVIFNAGGDANTDFRVRGDTYTHLLYTDGGLQRVGVNVPVPAAQLHVDQSDTGASISVLTLDQADVSEQFIHCIITGDTDMRLVTLSVTGTPEFGWDESEDQFYFSKGLILQDGDLNISTGDGIVHADGVAAGMVLVADGTRYVPAVAAGALPIAPVAVGDTLIATAGPLWNILTTPGAAGYVRVSTATTEVWDQTPTMTGDWTWTSAASANPVLTIENTNADAQAPTIDFYKNSASPADNDDLGAIDFFGETSTGAQERYAYILAESLDVTNGDTGGGLKFSIVMDAVERSFLELAGYNGAVDEGEIVFNQDGRDVDTRIEAVGVANAFTVRGSDGLVGIWTDTPDGTLHVQTSSAGAVVANAVADDLVVENSDTGGISILTPDDGSIGYLVFGNPADNVSAIVSYTVNTGSSTGIMKVGTHAASGRLDLESGFGVVALSIDSNQNILLAPTATLDLNGIANALVLDAAGTCTISAPTPGQIDIEVAGADDFTFTANSFNVLNGSVVTMADNAWIGLGAAAGRIEFDDQATDEVNLLSCNVGIGDSAPEYRLHVNAAGINVVAGFESTDAFAQIYLWDSASTDRELIRRNADTTDLYSGGIQHIRMVGGLVAIGPTAPAAKLYVDQDSPTATIPVLSLDQADVSEEMINFIVAATGAGNPVDTATAVGTPYARLRVAVNGTFKYIQLYNA